ncbi:hypothetical protein F441_05750 [Phytophthora nicotianae CJ01A1]|uniref:Uncharacterized protein n=1 Tax=Phytophthora nicotianae CJ01A1 TaxID=1317063 RepID=W2XDI9_PHYNI|nr:hypothetical protein F441_05750 [Phytophthora nicotianae CJ01A1]
MSHTAFRARQQNRIVAWIGRRLAIHSTGVAETKRVDSSLELFKPAIHFGFPLLRGLNHLLGPVCSS